MRDRAVLQYIDLPLFHISKTMCVQQKFNDQSCVTSLSQSEMLNKKSAFDGNIGFIIRPSMPVEGKESEPLDMNDSKAYLAAVFDILSSGLLNYCGGRIPLPSVFNWNYTEKYIGLYHDGLLNYLKFGFPLGLHNREGIRNNATIVTSIQLRLMQTKLTSSLIKNCKEEPYLDHLMRYHILNSHGPRS